MADKIITTLGTMMGPIVANTLTDNTDVVTTMLTNLFLGILIIGVPEDDACGVAMIEKGGITAISANALFSVAKDTAAHYNVYFEDDVMKIQNLVGNGKMIKASFLGLEETAA
jgi:hypothetical protein